MKKTQSKARRSSLYINKRTDENLSKITARVKLKKNLRQEPSDCRIISCLINSFTKAIEQSPDLEDVLFNEMDKHQAEDGRGKRTTSDSITYLIHDKENDLYKIGQSGTPLQRLAGLHKIYNVSLTILHLSANVSEADLSNKYQDFSYPRESYLDGYSEWFRFDEQALADVTKDFSAL